MFLSEKVHEVLMWTGNTLNEGTSSVEPWAFVGAMGDLSLHLGSSTQTSTLQQQLQHCCCSPAHIQRSHYCWTSGFDLSPHPRVTVLLLERLLVEKCCCPEGAGLALAPSQPGTPAEHLQHHCKSSSWLCPNKLNAAAGTSQPCSGASQVFPARAELDHVVQPHVLTMPANQEPPPKANTYSMSVFSVIF